MTATGRHPQRRKRGPGRQRGVIGLVAGLLSIVLVACSGSGTATGLGGATGSGAGTGSTATPSTVAAPALGGTADSTASCASST